MAKMFAWTTIYNGGKSKEGRDGRKIIMERNVIEPGEEISQAKMKCSDDEWEALVAGGSVRPYPLPKDMRENESPAAAVVRALTKGQGEISQDMLMELALAHPQGSFANADEEEESDVPVGA
jgi:hypothetical protein